MLGAVRGLIVVLLVGVIASAVPYVSAAAFGPMMQVVDDAGMSGNLGGVWDLRGPLVARENANIHSVIIDPTKMHDGCDTVVDVQVPSGGQKRLIALAGCPLRKPEVLLLDEPTENLDADQRARLTGVIRGCAKGRTCLVISHDMDFIAAVADRILVIEHGRIAQQGDHRTLIAEGGLCKRLYEAQNVDPDLVYPASAP